MRTLIASLLLGATWSGAATAQDTQLVYNAKPEVSRTTCEPQAVYDLVAIGQATPYRTTSASAPGGFDPSATAATCGSVTRALPLRCVTSTGATAPDQAACEPTARSSYERRNGVTVHKAPGTEFPYYMADTRVVGSAPEVTAIRITTDIVGPCMQITELEAYSAGRNVALASGGAKVDATAPYDSTSGAQYVNDGSMAGMYHSTCSGGNNLTLTLPSPVRVDRIAITGRSGQYGVRDVFGYQLLNGAAVVGSGQIDARNKVGEAMTGGSCQQQTYEWRSVPGTCQNGQAQNSVTCHDADTGTEVDASRCNASMRPAPSSNCATQTAVTTTTSIPEVQVGWCGYTSSGGGRYACGPFEDGSYKVGPSALWPYPSDLCTGKMFRGNQEVTPGGKNWVIAPVTLPIPGARCVIHVKSGYSGHAKNDRPVWESYYYDGPPTGRPGGTYIRNKP